MRAGNGRTGRSRSRRSGSRSDDGFAGPGFQKVDGALVVEGPKVHKVFTDGHFVVAGAFEFVGDGGDDAVDAVLARDEVLADGDAFEGVVCCIVALAGATACASEVVGEDLAFELVGAVGDSNEVVEDCEGGAECFGGAG